ncbi:hypothetical protein PLIIFM63780_006713 [Purpureocillium lilacinum]|nr:hypothetical protein PLIIFM63780_006713 [Purpureocillium lilacinum]
MDRLSMIRSSMSKPRAAPDAFDCDELREERDGGLEFKQQPSTISMGVKSEKWSAPHGSVPKKERLQSEKGSASYGSFPKKGTGDRREFDFKICEIIMDTDEDDPVADFVSDLAKSVKRWSRLAELDECSVEQDRNTYVAKVRVRARGSLNGSIVTASLDDAIKDLCRGLMAVKDGRRGRLEMLTQRSIWGIMPISSMFEAYWTATFFLDIMESGPEYLAGLADEYMQEGHLYCVPPLMVFCIATLFGLNDTFHFMPHILGISIDADFDLPRFMAAALPTVGMVFRWFSRKKTAPSVASRDEIRTATQLFERALADYKGKYDCMLTQLATINVAASTLLTAKTDLLEISLEKAREHHEKAVAAGAATAGAAGGAAIAAPVILGGLTIVAVYCAWNHFTQANDFDAECHRIKSVGSTCHAAWSKVFIMRLCLEWFRLEGNKNPEALHFSSPFMQDKWERFIKEHQATSGSGSVQDHAQLLGIWLKSEVESLRTLRGELP